MKRIFAIGDIHGCNQTFRKMLFDHIQVQKADEIYCVGDYIDRGPDDKGVVDTIIELRNQGFAIHTIRGNHEQLMMDSVKSNYFFKQWINNGGSTTLRSFGIRSFNEMPANYKSFFESTAYYFETPDYFFVHAGLNFQETDLLEDKEAMLWTRDFDPYQPRLKKLLIHGHTPKPISYILNQKGNCINIDGGCVYKNYSEFGNLVAINLSEKTFLKQACID